MIRSLGYYRTGRRGRGIAAGNKKPLAPCDDQGLLCVKPKRDSATQITWKQNQEFQSLKRDSGHLDASLQSSAAPAFQSPNRDKGRFNQPERKMSTRTRAVSIP